MENPAMATPPEVKMVENPSPDGMAAATPPVLSESNKQNSMVSPVCFKLQKQKKPSSSEVKIVENPSPDGMAATPPVLSESKKQNSMVSPVCFKLQKQKKPSSSALHQNAGLLPNSTKSGLPDKNTGFPEGRYTSPTDSLISPISRGLLAKGRRAMRPSHAFVPPKVLDNAYEVEKPNESTAS